MGSRPPHDGSADPQEGSVDIGKLRPPKSAEAARHHGELCGVQCVCATGVPDFNIGYLKIRSETVTVTFVLLKSPFSHNHFRGVRHQGNF